MVFRSVSAFARFFEIRPALIARDMNLDIINRNGRGGSTTNDLFGLFSGSNTMDLWQTAVSYSLKNYKPNKLCGFISHPMLRYKFARKWHGAARSFYFALTGSSSMFPWNCFLTEVCTGGDGGPLQRRPRLLELSANHNLGICI